MHCYKYNNDSKLATTPLKDKLLLVKQACDAVKWLHTLRRYAHLNISSENILVWKLKYYQLNYNIFYFFKIQEKTIKLTGFWNASSLQQPLHGLSCFESIFFFHSFSFSVSCFSLSFSLDLILIIFSMKKSISLRNCCYHNR